MAYRSRKEGKRADTATEGLVADMVRQFADRFAFARELVQNGIDAGATELSVSARYLGGKALFSVSDDGEGMSREILEGPLLTLFNSAKDRDDTKIGKYGVGFVSVFAVDPDRVVVHTWRGGEGWELVIQPDHGYELATADWTGASGTVVTLDKRMDRETFREHAGELAAALERWCRHARVPIVLTVEEQGSAPTRERIDQPLSVACPVQVTVTDEHMTLTIGAGGDPVASPARTTFAGFYNRGLTLWETSEAIEPELRDLWVKIDSPQLTHTLSRDSVRHDAAYKAGVRRAVELARGMLREALIARLKEAAEAREPSYPDLLWAACTRTLRLRARHLEVPLTDPLPDGATTMRLSELEDDDMLLCDVSSNAVTRHLARAGTPVMWAPFDKGLRDALGEAIEASLVLALETHSIVIPLTHPTAHDRALCDVVAAMLRAAGERVEGLALGELHGCPLARSAVRGDTSTKPYRVPSEAPWLSLRPPGHWLLLIGDDVVALARKRADVEAAGHYLARHLLVETRGEISRRQNDALLVAYGERT